MKTETFEEYLIKVSRLSVEYPYKEEYLISQIEYFRNAFKKDVSPYKALEILYFQPNTNKAIKPSTGFKPNQKKI